MTTTEDMMSFLLDGLESGLEPSDLSNFFGQLVWTMDDNGEEITLVRRRWLLSNNKKKVEVALYSHGLYVYNSYRELENCCQEIRKKWPDLEEKCKKNFLERWKNNHPEDS